MLHLDLYVKDCSAEFYANDIPIRLMDSNQESFHSLAAHHLLLNNLNTFKILVWPGDTPSNVLQKSQLTSVESRSKPAKVCLRLVKYPVGAFAGDAKDGEVIYELNWEYDQEKYGVDPYPYIADIKFDIGSHLGTWNWQNCDPINLLKELPAITKIVKQIHNDFGKGNGKVIADLAEPYLDDMGKALPAYGKDEFREDMINDINYNAEVEDAVDLFNPENHDFRLAADAKLVQIINKDWEPTIRTKEDEGGESYELPLFLGKLKGRWHIVA